MLKDQKNPTTGLLENVYESENELALKEMCAMSCFGRLDVRMLC